MRYCNNFNSELFPGYAHRRNVGDEHAGNAEQHVGNAEIKQAKTYAFIRSSDLEEREQGSAGAGGGSSSQKGGGNGGGKGGGDRYAKLKKGKNKGHR